MYVHDRYKSRNLWTPLFVDMRKFHMVNLENDNTSTQSQMVNAPVICFWVT
jgi:hypothetical protein